MIIEAKFFGKTKRVRAEPHNMLESEKPEKILWVERDEDLYALISPEFKNKRVALVHRRDWLKAKTTQTAE